MGVISDGRRLRAEIHRPEHRRRGREGSQEKKGGEAVSPEREYKGWTIEVESHKAPDTNEWGVDLMVSIFAGAALRRAPLHYNDGRVFPTEQAADAGGFALGKAWVDHEVGDTRAQEAPQMASTLKRTWTTHDPRGRRLKRVGFKLPAHPQEG